MDFTAKINNQFAALGFDDLDAYDIPDLVGYVVITDTQNVSVYRSAEGIWQLMATLDTQEEVTLDDIYYAIRPNLAEDIQVRYDEGYWRQDSTQSTESSLLSNDDVLTVLFEEIGETGNARVERGGLMIQKEENSSWMFHGGVEDPAGAVGVIHDFFSN